MTAEIVGLQGNPDAPQGSGVTSGTNLLLPPNRVASRFDHFPEEVYDLSAESHLARFLKVLLGDAGAGQVRKRLFVARLSQTLQGTHFYNLDRFYGGLFGVRRTQSEVLDLDPYTETATSAEWSRQHAKDASYRSRVGQFARALSHGATPTGMELVAEALLAADCEVYESYTQADASYQTYSEIEQNYPTYAQMEGVSYGTLEGAALGRMAGDDRREFIVRPKRVITQGEAYDLAKVLTRLKPADARFTIDPSGVEVYDAVPIRGALADSNFWEVIPQVVPRTGLVANPYQVVSGEPVEQPRPPFTGYQGEAWSYVGDILGVSAYQDTQPMPIQRVALPDGSWIDYDVHSGLLPRRHILAGRSVSDGVLVAHPYWAQSRATSPDLAPLYTDRVPVEALNTLLSSNPVIDALPANPAERFWATPERRSTDPTAEIMELRFNADRLINHVTLDLPHFPHETQVHAFLNDEWVVVARKSIFDSVPQYLAPGRRVLGHPQHSQPGHWVPTDFALEPITTRRLRIVQRRNGGSAPLIDPSTESPYSLGVRNLEPGYRVRSLADVPSDLRSGGVIGSTTDPVGSSVEFVLRQETADNLKQPGVIWKSEPQPVNYAVVNLYLDMRTPTGDAQIIERFYLDPTHAGAHLTIYWTDAVGEPSQEWYEDRVWTPIPRDYILQKGYLHIPATRARHFKFEFTSLAAEPFESFLPIVRKVRLFPRSLVQEIGTGTSDEAYPAGLQSEIALSGTSIYADALDRLAEEGRVSQTFEATEALYATSPFVQAEAATRGWVYGFTPWHQGGPAPRFLRRERHTYETVEIKHTTKVGFFVGLNELRAFSVNNGADDDTPVYLETFHDFRNLEPGFTWQFDPNVLSTGLASDVVAQSRVHSSLHNVRALQFATQQTDPEQLVPDDDFRDPALATSTWDDEDGWHRYGDSLLLYSAADHSVTMLRYAEPLLRPAKAQSSDLPQPVVSEVFAYRRNATFVDPDATGAQIGGIETPLLGAAARGRGYAAVRLTFVKEVSEDVPLRLQVVNGNSRAVLSELLISGRAGETVERVLSHDLSLNGTTPIRVRLGQSGAAATQIKIDTLSFFDEGILWEFSVNGGTDWVPAIGVRNNANGILTFPEPGNQLVWRATGLRPRQAVSAIKMRPQYVGVQNARYLGTQRGPNVSVYDADVPVQDDPMFTDWTKPVPRWWFAAYKRFPKLPVEGAPNVTEFARFYGRPVRDSVPRPTDTAVVKRLIKRSGADWVSGVPLGDRFQQPISGGIVRPLPGLLGSKLDPTLYPVAPEFAVRKVLFKRIGPDSLLVTDSVIHEHRPKQFRFPSDVATVATDEAEGLVIAASTGSPHSGVVRPVF